METSPDRVASKRRNQTWHVGGPAHTEAPLCGTSCGVGPGCPRLQGRCCHIGQRSRRSDLARLALRVCGASERPSALVGGRDAGRTADGAEVSVSLPVCVRSDGMTGSVRAHQGHSRQTRGAQTRLLAHGQAPAVRAPRTPAPGQGTQRLRVSPGTSQEPPRLGWLVR